MEVQIGTFTVHRHAYKFERNSFQLEHVIYRFISATLLMWSDSYTRFQVSGPLKDCSYHMFEIAMEALLLFRISSYADLFR